MYFDIAMGVFAGLTAIYFLREAVLRIRRR